MKTKEPGILHRALSTLGARMKAVQARRRRREAAEVRLRAVSVLRTRPGRLLHL